MIRVHALIATSIFIVGCGGPPRIDATSQDSLERSIEQMDSGLSEQEREQLHFDRMEIGFAGKDHLGPDDTRTGPEIFKPMHGLTAAEIRTMAEKIRKDRDEARKADIFALKRPISDQSAPASVPDSDWLPSDNPADFGDARIRVLEAAVDKVTVSRFGDKSQDEDLRLIIKIELRNTNPNKKITFLSWARADVHFREPRVTLTDNFDNNYEQITFGLGARAEGSAPYSQSVYPDKLVSDQLVFEVPIDTAKYVNLELPSENYGGRGMVRFRIPVSRISRMAK